MAFNPQDHIRKISGKDYLDIVWRVKWFRTEYPKNRLDTDLLATDGSIIFKATIYHEDGTVWATGHGSAPAFGQGQSTWKGREIEKAETAAIGRALKNIGFGTEYAFDEEDSDGDYLADAPIEKPAKPAPKSQAPANVSPMPQVDNHTAPWTEQQAEQFGKAWQKEGYKTAEILEVLGVKRLGEWKKSLWDANEVMNKAMAQGF